MAARAKLCAHEENAALCGEKVRILQGQMTVWSRYVKVRRKRLERASERGPEKERRCRATEK